MKQPEKIAKGAFADIWDLHNGTVLKAFRSESRAHGRVIDIRDHDLLTSVFCAQEANAYVKAKQIADIENHIPVLYGQQDPISFLPNSEGPYVKGAGFIIEKLEGRDQKITYLTQQEKDVVEPLLWELSENLLDLNVWDSSCFYYSDSSYKIIDFALWESSDYECHLYDHGKLNENQKQILRGLTRN